MGTNSNHDLPPVNAGELCKYFTLSEPGKAALKPDMMPDEFAKDLATRRYHADAVQLLAHYLPKRQAVFWALTCVKGTLAEMNPDTEAAIKATERWIAEPTEENRTATLKAADTADAGTPAGCTALAAYYSEGLPRTDDPKQNARAHFLTSKLVAAALLMAATADPEHMQSRFYTFVQKGLEIVQKVRRQ